MERGDDVPFPDFSASSRQTLNLLIISSMGLGLGIGMHFHRVFQAQILKHLSVAIRIAEGALKGTRALQELHSPSPDTLVFASKTLIKGYKASRRLNLFRQGSQGNLSIIIRRFKAYIGLVNLVRYAQPSVSGNGFLGGFRLLTHGYKLSSSFLKVLEGFVGFQLDSAVKSSFKACGDLVRAAYVARELKKIAIERCERRRGYCWILRTVGTRYGVRLAFKKMDIVYNSTGNSTIPVEFTFFSEGVLITEDHISDLLSLSIPIYEEIPCTAL